MNGSKTILVPLDFQDASLEALSLAYELAGPLGLEVVLMHARAMPVDPGFDPIITQELSEESAAAAKAALDELAEKHGGVRSLVRAGDPATQILAAIEEVKPALVAMGTHGRKGLAHFFLGSVAEKVVRESSSPVLIAHARQH